ncbi:hypothetical protein CDIOL_50390 [Clostridium diolis]|uniref:Transposase n=1 Tax=Clostridium diolis TaxID=223919 RepID=A0AAV3VF00_9CLOT|nr:hypothetical protein CDIOL_50390 [Clostridium diolis]
MSIILLLFLSQKMIDNCEADDFLTSFFLSTRKKISQKNEKAGRTNNLILNALPALLNRKLRFTVF